MIALLDIGNSRTKYCFHDNSERTFHCAVLNKSISHNFLTEKFTDVDKIVVSSVANKKITETINIWCHANKVVYQQVFSEFKKNTVISGYKEPRQLGVDRWLALIGVAYLYPNKNVLVIDAGTATTIDFLTKTGQHQGGWILAGINTLISSVLAETAQVKANVIEQESLAFGINTSENVHHAAWAATVGAINLAILEVQKQTLTLDELIITGGNANILASLISHECTVIEELVFTGLEAYL
jgi:type III pantothenate kinase